MIRELKDVRYVPQLNKNLISIGALEAHGLKRTLGEGVLKMSSGSLVVLKGIRCNNLYYLKGSAVTENLTTSGHLEDDSTRLWQLRLGQVNLVSLEARNTPFSGHVPDFSLAIFYFSYILFGI